MARKRMEILGDVATAMGYRRISKRQKIVARIDREDWLQHMAEHFGMSLLELVTDMNGKPGYYEDYYRRILSQDRREVSLVTSRTVPSSFEDTTGYVPLDARAEQLWNRITTSHQKSQSAPKGGARGSRRR